uniref:Putative toxin-antitoxin system toxin component, PIN family n=1 Tax=Candidatus Kentrum sp. FW TaxID=2126338 RepID=A0A450U0Y3_9GAMM|nr:MAG: putative toxin-antitoxin system toxin component, PIN family [Candidatus Kentron sp. FW]
MMTEPRLVIDTNVYISAFLKDTGNPAKLVIHASRNAEILFSSETLDELIDVIGRRKFAAYFSGDEI